MTRKWRPRFPYGSSKVIGVKFFDKKDRHNVYRKCEAMPRMRHGWSSAAHDLLGDYILIVSPKVLRRVPLRGCQHTIIRLVSLGSLKPEVRLKVLERFYARRHQPSFLAYREFGRLRKSHCWVYQSVVQEIEAHLGKKSAKEPEKCSHLDHMLRGMQRGHYLWCAGCGSIAIWNDWGKSRVWCTPLISKGQVKRRSIIERSDQEREYFDIALEAQ